MPDHIRIDLEHVLPIGVGRADDVMWTEQLIGMFVCSHCRVVKSGEEHTANDGRGG